MHERSHLLTGYIVLWADGGVPRSCAGTDRHRVVSFVDDDNSIFESDIEKLATAGITRGCNPPQNDRFCPDDRVTRAVMATFLTRALNLPTDPPAGFFVGEQSKALVTRYESRRDTTEGQIPDIYNASYLPRSFATGMDVLPDPDDVDIVNSPGRYTGWDLL